MSETFDGYELAPVGSEEAKSLDQGGKFDGYEIDPAQPEVVAKPAPGTKRTNRVGSGKPSAPAPKVTGSVTEDAPPPKGDGSAIEPIAKGGVSANNVVRSLSSGVPILGGLLNKADAATNAALAPVLNRFFDPKDQLAGDTFADRYDKALAIQEGMDKGYSVAHPALSAAGNMAGSVAGTIPAAAMAPTAFGMGGGPLLGRSVLSAFSGGGVNAADTAARGGTGGEIARSLALGGVLGGAAPGAGDLVGRGVSALSGGAARLQPGAANIANLMHEVGIPPMAAEARMAQLGPYGTLADVSPAFQAEAGGLAAKGGFPTQVLKAVMEARAAGKDTRISDAVGQHVGIRPDLTAEKEGIESAASAAADPYYSAARANPTPMDATPVLSYIDGQLATAKGGVAKTLQMARNLLVKENKALPGVTVPEDNAQGLLGARQALDDFISRAGDADTSAGKNALRQASKVRDLIDGVVKQDQNIAAGDKAFSTKISERDALDAGTDLFKPGTRIEDVRRSIAGKTPEQLDAMRKGALAALHDRLDGVSGDWGAARQMFAKSDANRQKLDALFPGAKDLFDKIEGEMAMRQTEQRVAAGSDTAQRRAIQEKYALMDKESKGGLLPALLGGAAAGAPGAAASVIGGNAFRSALNQIRAASNSKLVNQSAAILGTPYKDAGPLMDQVTRAFHYAPKISALSSGANALTNIAVRNQAGSVPSYVLPDGGVSTLLSLVGAK